MKPLAYIKPQVLAMIGCSGVKAYFTYHRYQSSFFPVYFPPSFLPSRINSSLINASIYTVLVIQDLRKSIELTAGMDTVIRHVCSISDQQVASLSFLFWMSLFNCTVAICLPPSLSAVAHLRIDDEINLHI